MAKVVVLGAGLVGREVARDLDGDFEVVSVDSDPERLTKASLDTRIATRLADLSDPETIKRVTDSADIVVGALPGFMGRATLEAVVTAGKNVVDIAFFPEDPFELDALARQQGVTALVDFGVAPGVSNLLMGYHGARMESVDRFECLVGGLPTKRAWPFEYKAGFSPADVIEEYTRPARYVENGTLVTRPALSDPELVEFQGVGTLESLNTDGLRTLATTMNCPNMKEKTLRYPGHGRFMEALRAIGLFDKGRIEVDGVKVSPLAVTSALIFPHWKLGDGEEEFTVMRVEIDGEMAGGRHKRVTYDLLDHFDRATGVSSMARTTGYTCTAGVRLLANGMYSKKGISPPEYVGQDQQCFEFIMRHLAERDISLETTVEVLGGEPTDPQA